MAGPGEGAPPRSSGIGVEHTRSWEATYRGTPFGDLPWFQTRPSAWIVRGREEGWVRRGGRHLDVGCGAGTNVMWLSEHGLRATGVDLAPSAVGAARGRALRRASARSPGFLAADALSLPFRSESFDSASDIGCFHTLPIGLRPRYGEELHRVMRGGGNLLLSWAAREETRESGPRHRLSVEEVVLALEPRFIVRHLEFTSHPRSWRGIQTYSALLERRKAPQPPPR